MDFLYPHQRVVGPEELKIICLRKWLDKALAERALSKEYVENPTSAPCATEDDKQTFGRDYDSACDEVRRLQAEYDLHIRSFRFMRPG